MSELTQAERDLIAATAISARSLADVVACVEHIVSTRSPRGETVTEWNVLHRNNEPHLQPWTEDRDEAESYLGFVSGPLVFRSRTTYGDVVTEWERA